MKWISKPFYDIMLQPALSVTLNEREIFSAAESKLTFLFRLLESQRSSILYSVLSIQQIYFLTTADADTREITKVNYYEAVLKPWVDYLESKNSK
jgi:hypothetical protein